MSDYQTEHSADALLDTQKLISGVEPPGNETQLLEDILAEYHAVQAPGEKMPWPPQAEQPVEEPVEEPVEKPVEKPAKKPAGKAKEKISPQGRTPVPAAERKAPPVPEQETEIQPVSMEEIVASTVKAVQQESAEKREKAMRRWEKQQSKQKKKKNRQAEAPLLRETETPCFTDMAARHKRWYACCRSALHLAVPALVLLWLPWLLRRFSLAVPFFADGDERHMAICTLSLQLAVSALCWPVFRSAWHKLRRGMLDSCCMAVLCGAVTVLDALAFLLTGQHPGLPPLGGVAATGAVFALWGLTGEHRALWETFRTVAPGTPACVVDCCQQGVAKGRGELTGFYLRTAMESSGAQWQRLLLPVIAAASLVFAVLASVGQGKPTLFLWCWSVILCTGTTLAAPLAYAVPYGRLAARLNKGGGAVAGQYGAAALTASRKIVAADGDLFPQGTVALSGLKLYGEERERALAYAAALAIQGGGTLGRVFEEQCRSNHIAHMELEHFHVHDDGGLGGMIHGETVLLGPPSFMRHRAVRLPATLPSKTTLCLAVDGELTAVFAVKYTPAAAVKSAVRALGRNRLQLALAVRDGNITPKLLKVCFQADGDAETLPVSERLALSDPQREAGGPNGVLYREGLLPFVELVSGSRRLCQMSRIGDLLTVVGAVCGTLLGFYLTFAGSYSVLTPPLLLVYLLLWTAPLLPLLWGVDRT